MKLPDDEYVYVQIGPRTLLRLTREELRYLLARRPWWRKMLDWLGRWLRWSADGPPVHFQ